MIEIILIILAGVFIGTLTGITPGIHTNLIATVIPSLLVVSSFFNEINLIAFIVSIAITHTFIDFIPSIYLGAPDEDTTLSTLPGHKMLLFGRGHEAVTLTLIGSTLAIICLIPLVPLFLLIVPKVYPFIEKMLAWFLIWICIFLIYNEKENKVNSIIIFILAGFLGIASLNSISKEPLLPLLTGLFGSSTIIYSLKSNTIIPEQIISKIKIVKKDLIKPTLITMLVSPICSFFPGLGSSQAAIIGSQLDKNQKQEQFLILLGSINTLVISISFVTLYLISKSRTGAANAISQIINLSSKEFYIILITIFVTTLIAIPLTIKISKIFAKNINKINYAKISIIVLIVLTLITVIFSGFFGLLIFITSTFLGLTCIEFGVRRGFLMGCLLIPTIIFYLPF